MDNKTLQLIGMIIQGVSSLGVLVALIALIVQIRSSWEQRRLSLIQQVVQSVIEEEKILHEDSELRPYIRGEEDIEKCLEEEKDIDKIKSLRELERRIEAMAHIVLINLASRVRLAERDTEILHRDSTIIEAKEAFASPAIRRYFLKHYETYPKTRQVLLRVICKEIGGDDGEKARKILIKLRANPDADFWEPPRGMLLQASGPGEAPSEEMPKKPGFLQRFRKRG